jgi:hypothetical protein
MHGDFKAFVPRQSMGVDFVSWRDADASLMRLRLLGPPSVLLSSTQLGFEG